MDTQLIIVLVVTLCVLIYIWRSEKFSDYQYEIADDSILSPNDPQVISVLNKSEINYIGTQFDASDREYTAEFQKVIDQNIPVPDKSFTTQLDTTTFEYPEAKAVFETVIHRINGKSKIVNLKFVNITSVNKSIDRQKNVFYNIVGTTYDVYSNTTREIVFLAVEHSNKLYVKSIGFNQMNNDNSGITAADDTDNIMVYADYKPPI